MPDAAGGTREKVALDKALIAKSYGVDPQGEPDAFGFLSKMLDFPLPEPWTENSDKQGRFFYWNPSSRHSSWTHPLASTHKTLINAFRRIKKAKLAGEDPQVLVLAEIEEFHQQGEEEISLWRVSHAPDGTPYFYKAGTQQTRWDNPRDELVIHQELRIRMLSDLLEPELTDQSRGSAIRDKLVEGSLDVTLKPDEEEASALPSPVPPSQPVEPKRLQTEFDAAASAGPSIDLDRALPGDLLAQAADALEKALDANEQGQEQSLLDGESKQCVVPLDELAIKLGLSFDAETDRATFHILRPVFAMDLPTPWRSCPSKTGRTDFYHPGTGERRQDHPMFTFFEELVAFLREQAKSDAPMSDPLTAQVFREASPQTVRERLGVWEGPFEAAQGSKGAATYYERLLPGADSACVRKETRRDDPRTEAAGNMTARFDAWHHLWKGFCVEDLFPFAEARISALVAQLCEAVVIRPGDRADRETVLHQWNWDLERRSPLVPEMRLPLTAQEERIQHEVTGLLGTAYGVALAVVAANEAPYAQDRIVAVELMKSVYRSTASRDFDAKEIYSEEEEFEQLEDTFENEDEEEESDDIGEGSEPEVDRFDPEPVLDEAAMPQGAELSAVEADEDYEGEEELDEYSLELPEAPTSTSEPRETDPVMSGIGEEAGEDADVEEEPMKPARDENGGIELFLSLGEPADRWAENALRPLTPRPTSPKAAPVPSKGRSSPVPLIRRQKGFDEEVWASSNFLRSAIIKPFVSDLGWRCHLEITKGMWVEGEEAGAVELEPPVPNSPARSFRGIAMAPVALEQVREVAAEEVESFREILRASNDLFDKCLSARDPNGGDRASTPLVQPHLDLERPRPRVHERSSLKRPDIPSQDRSEVCEEGNAAAPGDGYVPPPSSPSNQLREGLPLPPHLQGQLLKNKWGSRGCERPRSSERLTLDRRDLHMQSGPRVHSAGARARKPSLNFLEEGPDVGAKMAYEKLRHFLSRKCGRVESAFEQIDKSGRGFITMQEWLDGLSRLEYDRMEYAQQIFMMLDPRQHHVLTLSDLTGRRTQPIYDDIPAPEADEDVTEMQELLGEVLGEEVNAIMKEALQAIALAALRAPQPPLRERSDVVGWLRTRKKPKAKYHSNMEKQEGDSGADSDPEAEVFEMLHTPSSRLSEAQPDSDKDRASKKPRKLKTTAKVISNFKMPGAYTASSGSESDFPYSPESKKSKPDTPSSSKSPSAKTPVSKRPAAASKTTGGLKKAPAKRQAGVMAMMLQTDGNPVATAEPSAIPGQYQRPSEILLQEKAALESLRSSNEEKEGVRAAPRAGKRPVSKTQKERLVREHIEGGRSQQESRTSSVERARSEQQSEVRVVATEGKLLLKKIEKERSQKQSGVRLVSREAKSSKKKTEKEGALPEVIQGGRSQQEEKDSPMGVCSEQPPNIQISNQSERDRAVLTVEASKGERATERPHERSASAPGYESSETRGRSNKGKLNRQPQKGTNQHGKPQKTFGAEAKRMQEGITLSEWVATSPGAPPASLPSYQSNKLKVKSLGSDLNCSAVSTGDSFFDDSGSRAASPGTDSNRSTSPEGAERNRSIASKPVSFRPRQLRVVQVGRRRPQTEGGFFGRREGAGYPSAADLQQPPPWSAAELQSPLWQDASDEGQVVLGQQQRRLPSKPRTAGARAGSAGHNLFGVGFRESALSAPQPAERLLPYVPRGPNDVCKAYNHIFKLLNDSQKQTRLPKQKLAVHVSMPRLPGADETEMSNSKSAPDLLDSRTSTAASSAWRPSASMNADVEGVLGDHVQLPEIRNATR